MNPTATLSSLLALCALVATGRSQSVIYSQRGADDDRLGAAVADLGDVDGDGVRDHACGVPRDGTNSPSAGRVIVYSGATGTALYTVTAASTGTAFGRAVRACGDVNLDGRPDFLVGAPNDATAGSGAGAAFLYSGPDGTLLRTLQPSAAGESFGFSVSGAGGDTNGDGTPDLLVGAPDAAGGGVAYLFSGSNGAVLFRFGADFGDTDFGWSVRELGDDADSDGYPDFLIAAPGGLTMVNHDLTGYVRLMSGHSGDILWMIYGTTIGARAGTSISSTDDYDSDGIRDFIVGMPGVSPSGTRSGAGLVYSARTGAYLYSFPGSAALDRFGTYVAGLDDVDGDGTGDLMIATGRSNTADTVVYSGATGATLFTAPRLTGDFTVYDCQSAGDIDGDGHCDLIVGVANSWNGSDRGVAHVISGTRRTLTTDNHTVRVRTTDRQTYTLRAGAEHAGKVYLMVGSLSGTSPGLDLGNVVIPLNYDFYFNLLGQLPNTIISGSVGTLDASGNGTAYFAYANSLLHANAGLVFHHAYVVIDPVNVTIDMASNAVPLTAMPRF